MFKLVERTVVKEVATSPAVAEWNFWDFEHGEFVHQGHVHHWVLHEDDKTAVVLSTTRAPLLSFIKYNSLHVMVRVNSGLSRAWNRGLLGITGTVDYHFQETAKDHCRITMKYQFMLYGWQVLLAPVLRYLIGKWSDQIWEEDLPLKLRRQKVLRLGFKDFVGLPPKIEDRHNSNELQHQIPLKKLRDSNVLKNLDY